MPSLISVAIEVAVNESVLLNSTNGTVRNVARSITQAVGGDAAAYDAVKAEVASFYSDNPLDSSAEDVVHELSTKVATALLVIESRGSRPAPQPVVEERAIEEPTVESLTEVLRTLGRAAESEPESLNWLILDALNRFGLN